MERVRLSEDLQKMKYIVLLFVGLNIFYLLQREPTTANIIRVVIVIAVGSIFFTVFHLSKTAEFDDESLYLVGRGENLLIPLSRIISIKGTFWNVNWRRLHKISFEDQGGNKRSVTLMLDKNGYKQIAHKIREKNPRAVIIE